jgi:hypothetical protein
MIDLNYPGRGHRVNLLGTDPAGPQFREVGIGHYAGAVGITGAPEPYLNGLKDFLTEDFGTRAVGPFVLGVVYMDTDHDGFYDPGEGLAGVSVAPDSGDFFAVTGAAGGFAFPVGTGGTINVTASGGALTEPMQTQIVLTGVNAKADFVVPPPPKVTPKVLNLGFNFRPAKADTLKLVANVANVELPADLTGLSVTVTLGRVTRTFVLDAAGKATSGDARVVVKRGKGFAPHKVTFTLKGSDITGTTPFTAEGMDGLTAAKNVIVPLAGSIDLGTGPVALAANVKYNAKVAKNGSAVLKK